MRTMKFLSVLLMIVTLCVSMVGCSSDDDPVTDYASQVAGTYTGKLTVNNTVIEDAYVVYVYKISSTVVEVAAAFYSEGRQNYNVTYSNGQYLFTSESSSNITISVTGKAMTVSFLNGGGSMTTFNGSKD